MKSGKGGGGGALYVVGDRKYCAANARLAVGIWDKGCPDGKGDCSRPISFGLRDDLLGVIFLIVRPAKFPPERRLNRRLPAVAEYCGVEPAEYIIGVAVFEPYVEKAGKGEAGSGKMFG